MKRIYIIAIITIFLTGCCSIDKKDIEFNDAELGYFSTYKKGDIIQFENKLGGRDSIEIIEFHNEKFDKCGGIIQRKPSNTRWLTIKHLPEDEWSGTSQDMTTGGKIKIDYQGILWITKYPTDKTTMYSINFKDFHSKDDTVIGQFYSGPLKLNDMILTSYYLVEHRYPERVIDSADIKEVYWTKKDGLVAYRNKGGLIWTKKK